MQLKLQGSGLRWEGGEQVTWKSTWQCVTCLDTGVQLHLNEGGIVYSAHILSNTPHILQLPAHMCAAALGDATYHHKHNNSSSPLTYSSLISRWCWSVEKTNKETSYETFLDISNHSPTVANPRSKTRLWVKAVVSDKTEEMKGSLSAPTSPLAATCATDVGFSLPATLFTPWCSLFCSLIWATECSLPKSDARILSQCYCTPAHPREHVKSGTRTVDTYVPFSGYVALCPKFTAFVLFYGFFMGPFFGHHPQCQR